MDGSHRKHVLDFYSCLKIFLVFIPIIVIMVPESFPTGFNRPELSFPKPLFLWVIPFHTLLDFLYSCLFREHFNCILICQVFIYCHQPSPHGTFFLRGKPPKNIKKWSLQERQGRNMSDKGDIPKLSRRNPQQ